VNTESSAVEQGGPEGIPFKETHAIHPDNVTSITTSRETRAVDDMVKAYFDSLVSETVPEEIEKMIVGFR
jgi:hypothetical protein